MRGFLNKVVIFSLLTVVCMTGCGNSKSEEYDIPAGFTNGYTKADYEMMNSPAEENGLGGTDVYLTGYYEEVQTFNLNVYGNQYMATFIDDDGNEWLLSIDNSYYSKIDGYKKMEGHHVCFVGKYGGFSEMYQMPGIETYIFYDMETGNAITSKTYEYAYKTEYETREFTETTQDLNVKITAEPDFVMVEVTNTSEKNISIKYKLSVIKAGREIESSNYMNIDDLPPLKVAVQNVNIKASDYDEIRVVFN